LMQNITWQKKDDKTFEVAIKEYCEKNISLRNDNEAILKDLIRYIDLVKCEPQFNNKESIKNFRPKTIDELKAVYKEFKKVGQITITELTAIEVALKPLAEQLEYQKKINGMKGINRYTNFILEIFRKHMPIMVEEVDQEIPGLVSEISDVLHSDYDAPQKDQTEKKDIKQQAALERAIEKPLIEPKPVDVNHKLDDCWSEYNISIVNRFLTIKEVAGIKITLTKSYQSVDYTINYFYEKYHAQFNIVKYSKEEFEAFFGEKYDINKIEECAIKSLKESLNEQQQYTNLLKLYVKEVLQVENKNFTTPNDAKDFFIAVTDACKEVEKLGDDSSSSDGSDNWF